MAKDDGTFGFEDLQKAFNRIEQKYPNKTDAMLMAMTRVAANRTKSKTPIGKTKKLTSTWRAKKPKVYGKARVDGTNGMNYFTENADGPHRYVKKEQPDEFYATRINSLIKP